MVTTDDWNTVPEYVYKRTAGNTRMFTCSLCDGEIPGVRHDHKPDAPCNPIGGPAECNPDDDGRVGHTTWHQAGMPRS